MFNRLFTMLIYILFVTSFTYAYAEGDFTNQQPIKVTVELGTKDGKHVFKPSHLSFETGKLYRLILTNPSVTKHYFSSDKLARAVFTRKVQITNKQGKKVAEVKGTIREIEVYPGGNAEWWFVPIKTGKFDDLVCTISGHKEAGMTGSIEIK